MAEFFLKKSCPSCKVYSAGTKPSKEVHPKAITVMREKGIDITSGKPKSVNEFISTNFEYVITVCGGAKETCPAFIGNVKHRLHIGFDDPAEAKGSEKEILSVFRRVRDEIENEFNYLKITGFQKTE